MKGGLKQTARLALFLLSALFLNIFLFSVNACFAQEAAKFQVALLNVRDLTPAPSEATRYQAYDMLRLQIKQTPFFETKKEELVEMWLTKTKIVSSDEETAADMARGLNLDGVFIADIYEITVNEKTKEARIELQLQLIDKKGEVISRTYTYAGSFKKPGFAGETKLLVQEALQNAAASSLQETQKNLSTKGIVASIKGNGVVVTNLNLTHGIKKGAQLVVTRNGSKIARLVVIDVNKSNSLSQITEMVNGKLISPSDNVQLVFNPLPDPKAEKAKLKTKSSKSAIRTLTSILVAGGVVALLASGKKSDAQSASPSGVSISLSADPGNIIADKKTTSSITASLKDSQINVAVPDGTEVAFKTTAGTLNSGAASTSGGIAKVELQSDDKPGTAVITASYGNSTTTTTVQFTSLGISASANPTSIAANGTSTSTITVTVKDATNVPAPDGTSVTFSTTEGTIGGSSTTKNGVASTTLTSSTSATKVTATVTAKAGGAETTTTVDFVPVEPKVIFLSANPTSIPADGKTTATMTAIVKDENNNPVVDGTQVTFTSNLGTVTQTATTSEGQAQATITSTTTGTATVIAGAGTVSTSATVTFTSLSISLTASQTSIPADGVSTTTITLSVKNASSGSALQNTAVTLTTSNGTFTSNNTNQVTKNTDANGNITETLKSDTKAGTATITVSTSDTTATSTVNFSPLGVSTIAVDVTPSSITADGKSTATISVTVKDIYGNFVQDGTEVKVTISDPNAKLFTNDGKIKTTNGIATTTVTSSTSANKPLIRACYPSTVACSSADPGDIHGETYVTFSSGTPAFLSMAVNSNNIKGLGIANVTDVITAQVFDSSHIVVSDGTSVSFTTNCGIIIATAKTGDALSVPGYGVNVVARPGSAYALYATTGESCPSSSVCNKGQTTISAKSGDAEDIGCVYVTGLIATISLSTDTATIKTDGSTTASIIADAYDINGNPVTNGLTIEFQTTLGTLDTESEDTNGV